MTPEEIEREKYILERINAMWKAIGQLGEMIEMLAKHQGLDTDRTPPRLRLVRDEDDAKPG